MKMRQPLSHFERAFAEETALDRDRRESLRKTAERRAARRRSQRAIKQGKARSKWLRGWRIFIATPGYRSASRVVGLAGGRA